MKQIFLTFFALFIALGGHAQSSQLLEADEDSTISVVAYFSKGDSLVYDYTHQKERIKDGGDTLTTVDVTTRFLVTVTDSTSEGYKMLLVPQEQVKGNTIYDESAVSFEDLLSMPLGVACRFSTDEMGSIQRIDNWMEIRDSLKANYKRIFDDVYTRHPGLDSVLSRQRMESTFLLRCSSENGVMQIYEPLTMLFNAHGAAFSMKKERLETKNELGYPAQIDIEAFYTVPKEDTDNEGDYAVVAETTTDMTGSDLMDFVGGSVGMIVNDSIAGKLNESLKSDEFTKMKVQGVNHEIYTYFFNGWPKAMVSEKRVRVDGKDGLVESRVLEWVTSHWSVYEEEEDDSQKQGM